MPQLTTLQYFIIFLVVALLLFAYSKGFFSKNKGSIVSEQTAPDRSSVTKTPAQLDNLATSFYTEIANAWYGSNFFFGTGLGSLLDQANNFNDADLIALSNTYARKYPNADYKTLKDLLLSVTLDPFEEGAKRYRLTGRLTTLGL